MSFDGLHGFNLQQHPENRDFFAFEFDFTVAAEEGKATVTENADGDLIIEGYAAVFDGVDRLGENFAPEAFPRAIADFLKQQAALCYHHKKDLALGKVLDLRLEEGKGLWMQARVDHQPESSPLRWIYNGVKKGTLNGLSVGGFFTRALREGGQKIVGVDMTEISITPVPCHPGTSFAVVSGKALDDVTFPAASSEGGSDVREVVMEAEEGLRAIQSQLLALDRLFTGIIEAYEGKDDEDDEDDEDTEQVTETVPPATIEVTETGPSA